MGASKGKRILLVDDEPAILQSIRRILEFLGYEVETAPNAFEAVARTNQAAYDLILTDMSMPGMSGEQLARALKERNSSQKIALVTGTPPITPADCFDGLLLKPFSAAELHRLVLSLTGDRAADEC